MFSLKSKSALVTVASSGIGKAVAIIMAKQGATVFVAGLNKKKCRSSK